MKKLLTLTLTLLLAFTLVACGSESSDQKISLNGSTSMQKLVTALGESYKQAKGVSVEAEFTGSSAGIQALLDGSADIADSSRALKDEEKKKGLVENIVAIDGIAVALNKNNSVANLTKQQLIDIYLGKITNWKEIGGKDEKIVVIGREAASGTRSAFEELLEIENKAKYAQELDNTGAVVAKVAATSAAIGYVSLDVVDNTIKTAKLEGIEANVENIQSGKYFLQRPFVMATKGEISKQSEAVQDFFKYVKSDEGQKIIDKVGLIRAK